ncbi:LysR family transcriptional regulator [Bordetella bronchialis]|nr:LysR family transcriptional regulator [Bordetella bronchialis]
MDIPLLEMFVAAVEAGSLSRAAESGNLVISAVSKRISELERQTGTVLLRRHGRGVEPTPAGAMLYQRAKAILRGVAQAHDALAAYSRHGVPKIRLAANPSTTVQFLPGDISAFLRRHPDSHVDLIEAYSPDIPRMVSNGEAEVGIYHAEAPSPGLHSVKYRSDRVGLVVPRGHPLEKRKTLALEDALDYQFLGYFPRHALERFLELAGSTLSRPPIVRSQVSSYEARCRMVAEGLGLGIVPEIIARSHVAQLSISWLPLSDAWASRDMYMCVRDLNAMEAGVRDLFDHLARCAANQAGDARKGRPAGKGSRGPLPDGKAPGPSRKVSSRISPA